MWQDTCVVLVLASALLWAPVLQSPVIPRPTSVQMGNGSCILTNPFVAYAPLSFEGLNLCPPAKPDRRGIRRVELTDSPPAGSLRLVSTSGLPAEGYRLTVDASGAKIEASARSGFQYGLQTMQQWLEKSPKIPFMEVEDCPQFGWRGMHLDCARHFFSVAEVKSFLDSMARFKFNRFHWHLTDDSGWRFQSQAYPQLTEKSAHRVGGMNGALRGKTSFVPAGTAGSTGGAYSPDQIRDVVQYAKARAIEVVPEIDLPGHSGALLNAMPMLRCEQSRGANFTVCAGNEDTYDFLETILGEVSNLFPFGKIHIGGDEVDQTPWKTCPKCRARMKEQGFTSTGQLQGYFTRRMSAILAKIGKDPIAWDEVVETGVPKGTTVMSWRGLSGGLEAIKQGHTAVMSPTWPCYFDYDYEGTPTEAVYNFEPSPRGIPADEAARILGGQGNVWTEYLDTYPRVEEMIFPRMIALSEALWTPLNRKDYRDFRSRLTGAMTWLSDEGHQFTLEEPQPTTRLIVSNVPVRIEVYAPPAPGYSLKVASNPGKSFTLSNPTPKISVAPRSTVSIQGFLHGRPVSRMIRVRALAPTKNPKLPCQAEATSRTNGSARATLKIPTSSFDLRPFVNMDKASVAWTGSLLITQGGLYEFSINSEDQISFRIAGVEVLRSLPVHGTSIRSGTAYLCPGRHRFALTLQKTSDSKVLECKFRTKNLSGDLSALIDK